LSEHEFQPRTSHASLLSVIDDLEQGIEALTASLDSLRATVRVVAAEVRSFEQPPASQAPLLTVVEPEAAAEPEAVISDVTEGAFSWGASRLETPAIEPAPVAEEMAGPQAEVPAIEPMTSADNSEPATELDVPADEASEAEREEVRRAVEAMRGELEKPQAPAAETDRDELRRTVETTRAELSWSTLRVDAGFSFAPTEPMDVAPSPVEEPVTADPRADDDDLARREEVRLAVERARAAMDEANKAEDATAVDPEEARREEVRLAVERARAEMMGKTEAAPADDDEARREEVRRVVENTRGALSWSEMKSDGGSWGQFKPEPSGFNIGPDQAPPKPLPADPEEARREEVRRAVEATRADIAPADGAPRIVPIVPRPGAPLPKGADFNGPPIIVIEDPTGRVELSQVFATLSKVDGSAQAALLNYSPHSVTIGLGVLSPVPDPDQLVLAAQSVFGRSCTVKLEGNRTAIEVGTHLVG
jgi:hypothetical protein